ncbi:MULTISPECIES: hypothetical protein [Streptomyces]|uniref:hypothetical protein n=1 Tax=Streptomyces TaxID=1883 RepID=UPI001676C992|nr:hypothetical protein [Streptomyces sp. QHH-9511]GGT94195.1 hypothetical protein GCM10010272_43960 [Streptomyces lateritius]
MSQQHPGPPRRPDEPPAWGGPQQPGPWGPPPRKKLSTGAIVGISLGGVFAFLVIVGAVTGEGETTDGKAAGEKPAPTAPATSRPATATPSAPAAPSGVPSAAPGRKTDGKKADTGKLPAFLGKGLQYAQDEAQSLGFYSLRSHDALGRGRNQAFDRNWKVCFQAPAPGTHKTDVTVDFGTVKLEENCPKSDLGAREETEAGGTMPDFAGKSVKVARGSLPSNASITVTDAAEGRMVLMESNWKVCTQDPEAGAALNGRPVSFTAVKFEESCP